MKPVWRRHAYALLWLLFIGNATHIVYMIVTRQGGWMLVLAWVGVIAAFTGIITTPEAKDAKVYDSSES